MKHARSVTGLLVGPGIAIAVLAGASQAAHAATPVKHASYTPSDHDRGPGHGGDRDHDGDRDHGWGRDRDHGGDWDHGWGRDRDHDGDRDHGWGRRDPRWGYYPYSPGASYYDPYGPGASYYDPYGPAVGYYQ
jgi:hypothetical protein